MNPKPAQNLPTVAVNSDWDRLKEEASVALRSGLLPAAINTPEKAIAIAMMGKELGLPIMASLTGLFVVNGKVQLSGALMLRLIYERVPGASVTVLTTLDKASSECVVEMSRPGGKPQQFRYTIEEAKRAGFLSKQPWQLHPATMLRWSAIRTGARIVFADALAGCYMEDEIQAPAQHITAETVNTMPNIPEKPTEIPAEMASFGGILRATLDQNLDDVPVDKPVDDGGLSEISGDTVIPNGAFRGTKLKDKPKEEWAAYASKTVAKLNDPAFPDALKGDAEYILSIVNAYLGK